MNAQDYFQSKLDELLVPSTLQKPVNGDMSAAVLKLVLSKKFRKYSVDPEVLKHITASVEDSIANNQPIKFTLPFGGYKLWRLDETPEADWAELFMMMYVTKWLAPVCAIYEHGVWFDFFSDDVIVPRLNNVPAKDVAAYKTSFEALLKFIKPYQSKNLNMTLSRVIDQYDRLN